MRMLLEGRWVDREARIEVRDPEDGALVDTVPRADAGDAERAVRCAERGAEAARRLPAHERARVLLHAADALASDHEEFARTVAREGIKTIREARREVSRAVETLRLSAEEARRLHGETIPFDSVPGAESRVGYWRPAPVGIVVAITPFNDPLNLVAHKVGPAIAAGDAVVLKPDSRTPLSALKLAAALHEAGLPDGVLQVVTGPGSEVGAALVRDPRVRMVSFTGGRDTGARIAREAGLKKLAMELGSNAPVIVLEDADLDAASEACASGAFAAAGQNCLHVQRVLVHEAVYDAFAERFTAAAAGLRTGPKASEETDMGPMISEDAARRVERLVGRAREVGGRVRTGGTREGTVMAPTVLEGVPDDHPAARDEIYGPVTLLSPFAEVASAVRRANGVDFGLQAGIFTRDGVAALRIADELRYGGVMINDSSDFRVDAMPFGGFKGSGLGREGVPFAVREMTEPKLVCFDLS